MAITLIIREDAEIACFIITPMGIKPSPDQLKIYKSIDEILWNDWDPINLNNFDDWPKDEYQSYVPIIFDLKTKGANEDEIASALYKIQTNRMEITGGFDKCEKVAEKIINL